MEYNIDELFVGRVEFACFVPGKECFTNRYIFRKVKFDNNMFFGELISHKNYYPLLYDECFFVGVVKIADFSDVFPDVVSVTDEDIARLEAQMYAEDNGCVRQLVAN